MRINGFEFTISLFTFIFMIHEDAWSCVVDKTAKYFGNKEKITILMSECYKTRLIILTYKITKFKISQQISQNIDDIPDGHYRIIDADKDNIPDIEITNDCGAVTSCEREIIKLSNDKKKFFTYYKGGYSSIFTTKSFIVTQVDTGFGGAQYFLYDKKSQLLNKPKFFIEKYPLGYDMLIKQNLSFNCDLYNSRHKLINTFSLPTDAQSKSKTSEIKKICLVE